MYKHKIYNIKEDFMSLCIGSIGINCNSHKTTEIDVTNALSSAISTANNNINNLINQTISDISSTMVNNNTSKIDIDTNASNYTQLNDITASGGGTIDITQMAKNDATSIAITQIASNQESLNDLSQSTINSINASQQNSAQLQASLSQLVQISQMKDNAGGPEGMVKNITDGMNAFANSEKSSDDIQRYNNKIGINVNSSNLDQNSISNLLSNTIKNKLTTNNLASCRLSASASNDFVARNIYLTDGTSFHLDQEATLESFNKCLAKLDIGTALTNQVLQSAGTTVTVDQLNKIAADLKAAQDAKNENIDKQGSAIMDSLNNLVNKGVDLLKSLNPLNALKNLALILVVIVVGLIALLFALPMIMNMFGGMFKPHVIHKAAKKISAPLVANNDAPIAAEALAKSLKYLFN
jgi:hypothetical protein